jgi:hypothetical protein
MPRIGTGKYRFIGHLCGLRDAVLRDNSGAIFCKRQAFDLMVK